MHKNIDILDRLQDEEGYVRLTLVNGQTVYGLPQCVVFDEDEDGWETIKRLYFEALPDYRPYFWGTEDIASYQPIERNDIPSQYKPSNNHQ